MKIVQFVNNLDMGGLERLAVELAYQQKSAGHTPMIYCLTHRGFFADEAEASGIRVVAFQKPSGPSPMTVRKIVAALRQDRPDVLHTHNHLVHHYGVAAGRFSGVPAIVNTRHRAEAQIQQHGDEFVVTTQSPDKKADLIFRATLPWTDALVMISESTRQFFVRHRGFPERKTHVILNGAPLHRFARFSAKPGAERPRIRFGTASRMVAEKDHFTLLRAFAETVKSLPSAELHIAGEGRLHDRIASLIAELKLNERVFLHGAVGDVPAFLSKLDIFVMSSVSEGLPIIILEAMAAGLPIVSTRVGGIPEAAVEGLNAKFADPGDASGLAQQMIHMAQCQSLAEIGAHGKVLVAERFQIAQTWLQYEKLFDRVRFGRGSAWLTRQLQSTHHV
jgi:glycosyltransferase involved in cell wall biosynthesis